MRLKNKKLTNFFNLKKKIFKYFVIYFLYHLNNIIKYIHSYPLIYLNCLILWFLKISIEVFLDKFLSSAMLEILGKIKISEGDKA